MPLRTLLPLASRATMTVARCLQAHAREYDFVARYGGEEFVLILAGTGLADATSIAERLRQALATSSPLPRIRASMGLAVFPNHAVDAPSLVRAADAALFRVKRAGRDRVSTATTSDAPAATSSVQAKLITGRCTVDLGAAT